MLQIWLIKCVSIKRNLIEHQDKVFVSRWYFNESDCWFPFCAASGEWHNTGNKTEFNDFRFDKNNIRKSHNFSPTKQFRFWIQRTSLTLTLTKIIWWNVYFWTKNWLKWLDPLYTWTTNIYKEHNPVHTKYSCSY